ncbi:MAG: YicC/YloC family endoribonuclease, partial [Ruminococcus sp.]
MRSMTGYGKSQSIIDGREISVEIRSVNHRYYEFSSRIPRNYVYLEEKLKNLLHEKIFRGKVEISVSINNIEVPDCSVEINKPVLESYFNALAELSVNGISVDEKLSDIYGKTYRIAND